MGGLSLRCGAARDGRAGPRRSVAASFPAAALLLGLRSPVHPGRSPRLTPTSPAVTPSLKFSPPLSQHLQLLILSETCPGSGCFGDSESPRQRLPKLSPHLGLILLEIRFLTAFFFALVPLSFHFSLQINVRGAGPAQDTRGHGKGFVRCCDAGACQCTFAGTAPE